MRFLFPAPIVYNGNDSNALQRDGARFAKYFVSKGHEGIKIVFSPASGNKRPLSPLLFTASYQQWCDPDFWKGFGADGVLLYGGFLRSMEPVAQAIRTAGIPLALKCDAGLGISL